MTDLAVETEKRGYNRKEQTQDVIKSLLVKVDIVVILSIIKGYREAKEYACYSVLLKYICYTVPQYVWLQTETRTTHPMYIF